MRSGPALREEPPRARATRARAPPFPLTAPGRGAGSRGARARCRQGAGRRRAEGSLPCARPSAPPPPAGPARAAPPGLRSSGKEAAAAPVSAERRRAQPGPRPPPARRGVARGRAGSGGACDPRPGRGKPRARPLLTATSPRGAALSPRPAPASGSPAPQGPPAAPSARPAASSLSPILRWMTLRERRGAGGEGTEPVPAGGEAQVGPRLHPAGESFASLRWLMSERDGGCVWSSLGRNGSARVRQLSSWVFVCLGAPLFGFWSHASLERGFSAFLELKELLGSSFVPAVCHPVPHTISASKSVMTSCYQGCRKAGSYSWDKASHQPVLRGSVCCVFREKNITVLC